MDNASTHMSDKIEAAIEYTTAMKGGGTGRASDGRYRWESMEEAIEG